MNDPGLDEPAGAAAQDVNDTVHDEDEQAEQEEREYLDPSQWWFASTASPLIAGTFGPIANGFSICALVENGEFTYRLEATRDTARRLPIRNGLSRSIQSRSSLR